MLGQPPCSRRHHNTCAIHLLTLQPQAHAGHCVVLLQVDLNGFQPETLMSEPVFADQVHLSNVLLGSKPDLATKEQQEGFLDFAEQLFPPKQQVRQEEHVIRLLRHCTYTTTPSCVLETCIMMVRKRAGLAAA